MRSKQIGWEDNGANAMSNSTRQPVFCLIAVALFTAQSQLNAGIIINIQPAASNKSKIILTGSSTARSSATVRTSTGTGAASDDTSRFTGTFYPGGSGVNEMYAATGGATITIDGVTQTITHVFLDKDLPDSDIGFRVDSELAYNANDASSWTGTLTIDVPFSRFAEGSYSERDKYADFAAQDSSLVINPEPGSLLIGGITGVGMAFGALRRRRRQRQAEQQADAPETAV